MKIVRFYECGEPDVLRIEEVDTLQPRIGEVLIKVEVIGVNYTDISHRQGVTRESIPFPYTPGVEVVGTISQTGEGVTSLPIGTQVIALLPHGGYAEYVTAPAANVLPIPAGIDAFNAVALPLQGLTAFHIISTFGRLQSGERIVVHAAAGGVGALAVQLAKAMGAGQIIGTASSQSKLEYAMSLGADVGVNYTQNGWANQILDATDGKGADLILEMLGGDMFNENFTCLAPFGRIMMFGAASGKRANIDVQKLSARCHTVTGYYTGFMSNYPQLYLSGLEKLIGYVLNGQIKPQVNHSFPLGKAAEAHRQMEARQTTGKIVLLPSLG